MPLTLELPPELQAMLARQAAQQGIALDVYAACLLEQAAKRSETSAPSSGEVIEALERLKNVGKAQQLSLGGMTIRDLRDESRPK